MEPLMLVNTRGDRQVKQAVLLVPLQVLHVKSQATHVGVEVCVQVPLRNCELEQLAAVRQDVQTGLEVAEQEPAKY